MLTVWYSHHWIVNGLDERIAETTACVFLLACLPTDMSYRCMMKSVYGC